jgi:hypothetical protein
MYRLIFLLFLFACEKDCERCFIATESNRVQAELKCAGLANSFPRMDYFETFAGTKCGSEIDDFTRKQGLQGSSVSYCGMTVTEKHYRICR